MSTQRLRPIAAASFLALCGLAFVGCTTTHPDKATNDAATKVMVDEKSDATLTKLYNTVPGAREMGAASKGMLVFPSVVGGSLVIGAEYGRGALRTGGKTQAYYSIAVGSVGVQAGAQSKSIIYLFSTQEALDKFRASKGWTAGVDATVAVASLGANGSVDTNTMKQPVVAFVLANAGLEVGASLQGMKISELAL
jgi:lipid-binding SYLF domain-containing protein